ADRGIGERSHLRHNGQAATGPGLDGTAGRALSSHADVSGAATPTLGGRSTRTARARQGVWPRRRPRRVPVRRQPRQRGDGRYQLRGGGAYRARSPRTMAWQRERDSRDRGISASGQNGNTDWTTAGGGDPVSGVPANRA